MDRTLHPIRSNLRTRLWLLLPVLLVLSQHGAWLHELGHVAHAANPHQVCFQQAQNSAENGVCASCQSFGQLGSALSSSTKAYAAAVFAHLPQSRPQYPSPRAQLPAPRNRGPPRLA